ncbi:MAG: Gfo/Idh/MocA family oxidoreductase [Candidatus Hinthialibacter antarcticus]|nr:Gfo/Idh/MocA family oxidoreductase [Candidatus Hinthialibacter antarcticus]
METQNNKNRRSFMKTTAASLALSAPAVQRALGANDKVRVGFIGVGNRGTQLLHGFMKQPDVEIAALCDVFEPYRLRKRELIDDALIDDLGGRIPMLGETFDPEPVRYADFRRVLDQKDIDAVVIASPDHWHAIQMIQACQSGKDVYVEKPLSVTVVEGRKMVEAARRYNRVAQVGLHRRSSKLYDAAHQRVQRGDIGKVTVARSYRISNMYPNGIGAQKPSNPPKGMDWDLWLGPRPERPYQDNMSLYKFRWWQSYSSQVANWGVHYFDAIRWMVDEQAPISISAHGGRFAIKDDRTVPDTLEVIHELPSGMLMVFGQYEASGGSALEYGEIELRGTQGNFYANESSYIINPSTPGQFQEDPDTAKKEQVKATDGDLTEQHIRNFVDCIKSRDVCNCDIEIGHRSTTFSHLANIAWATKSRIDWDAKTESIPNNPEANDLLHYEYRKPWSLG